jgi:hypothetical protein
MARKGGAFAVGITTGVADHVAFNAINADLRAHVVLPNLVEFLIQDWMTL